MALIMNDETVIENGRAGYADGHLWLWFPGFTIQNAAAIAFDPEKTSRIVFHYGEKLEDVYEGFTNCVRIMAEENEIAVCMTKGAG